VSDEIARLEAEIGRLNNAIAALADIPDAQVALREQLARKRVKLAALTGGSPSPAPTQTTIHGDVTGSVMSGTFSGPVNVGGESVTQGPQISGPITANRDVNVATNQTIHNVDKSSGDHIQVGDITGSTGVAIGRGARSTVRNVDTGGGDYAEGNIDKRQGTFVSGDQFNLSGNYSGANVNIKSTLSNVTQSIGAAPHCDAEAKEELKQLIGKLNAALQQAPPDRAADAEAVAETARAAVEQVTKEKPNKKLIQIHADGLKAAALSLAPVLPVVVDIATKIADKLRMIIP
jgi:hypothetical protein